jgi:hypothetical protein
VLGRGAIASVFVSYALGVHQPDADQRAWDPLQRRHEVGGAAAGDMAAVDDESPRNGL